ncbi:Y-family DNA polymerase [Flavobacterium sp.]|jgi:DNA polymerase V|uniref:Y-family DNA polymerase n=1 Tax=Flavobacterium sp. TaxID=239 RepID=UPI0037C0847C
MYALVDCNNFYASCERVFKPELAGKPIAILSNNDGCIISRSDEAKALGIPMGAPEFKVRAELQKHNVIVFSSNYALYGDLSSRVMHILATFSANIEVYSIDEAFLNFDGMQVDNYKMYGQEMKSKIAKWLSIPVCVGFGSSKALSKIANKIARKFPVQTQGVHIIDSEEKRIKALKWTKIGDVWGIGRRLGEKMRARNILTAYDFVQPHHKDFIKNQMGVVGLRLIAELQGQSVLGIDEPENKKSIAVTRSFPQKISEYDDLRERISTFATVCGEKLRKQKSCCHSLMVFLGVLDEENPGRKKYYHKLINIPFETNSGITLSNTAIKGLEYLYDNLKGQKFHKAGVIVTQLTNEDQKQFQLFEEENPKHLALMQLMDRINKKAGDRKVKLATQGDKTWNMKQTRLSPKYTTQITDIMKVKCQ